MPPPAPPPPFPPAPRGPGSPVWLAVGLAAAALAAVAAVGFVAFLLWFGGPGASVRSTTEASPRPRLESRYAGTLRWEGNSVPISWRDAGTLDNDGDHHVVMITGPDVSLRVVWGWMDSAGSRIGARARVDQQEVPAGWPKPDALVVERPDGKSGWNGRLLIERGDFILLTLHPNAAAENR